MRLPKDTKILIVDDEPALRKAMIFDFKRKGFQVYEASNGRQAYDIVFREKVDIVLSDVRMPDGDGVELLERIKGNETASSVVMFITGFADLTWAEAYNKGAEAIFSKPFDRKALMAKVMSFLVDSEERWKMRGENIPDTPLIELDASGEGQVVQFALGSGGIFLVCSKDLPAIDQIVHFRVRLSTAGERIEGLGIVRWIRKAASGEISGCGIEFDQLEDHCRASVIKKIALDKPIAFIPMRN